MTYEITIIDKFPNHWSDSFMKAIMTGWLKQRWTYSADKASCLRLERLANKTQKFIYKITWLNTNFNCQLNCK